MIGHKELPKLSDGERVEFLHNAYSSFRHGVEHFAKYGESEENIKFSILHVFHAVELLVKGYLGSVNLNLLKEKIDDNNELNINKDRLAGIATLLSRMEKFSAVRFDTDLIRDIHQLREKRNEIEHRKFSLETNPEIIVLLCRIINGLLVFSKYQLQLDLAPGLVSNTKISFDEARTKIDPVFATAMKRALELVQKGYSITTCPFCLNTTVPYRRQSAAECTYCRTKVDMYACELCHELFPISSPVARGYPGWCDGCQQRQEEMHDEMVNNQPPESYDWDDLEVEKYD